MKVRSNDEVVVLTGDDKGTRAKVLRVLPEKNKIVVEGVNLVYKHVRPGPPEPPGRPALEGDAGRRLERRALLPVAATGRPGSAPGSSTTARRSAAAALRRRPRHPRPAQAQPGQGEGLSGSIGSQCA